MPAVWVTPEPLCSGAEVLGSLVPAAPGSKSHLYLQGKVTVNMNQVIYSSLRFYFELFTVIFFP